MDCTRTGSTPKADAAVQENEQNKQVNLKLKQRRRKRFTRLDAPRNPTRLLRLHQHEQPDSESRTEQRRQHHHYKRLRNHDYNSRTLQTAVRRKNHPSPPDSRSLNP